MNTSAPDVSRRNSLIAAVALVVGLAGGGYLGREGILRLLASRAHAPLPQSVLVEAARKANAAGPKMIDSETELSSTTALEGTLVYRYRVVNAVKDELDAVAFETAVRPKLVSGVCSAPETRDGLLKHGVTMRYVYGDKNQVVMSSMDISLKDCPPENVAPPK